MKRLFDLIVSILGLVLFSPLILIFMLLVWLQDFHNPFYIANRVGREGKIFKMYKLRSMIINADKSGVDSTSSSDRRITVVGKFVRKYKLDELTQLINVFLGDMSLVGPRPNVKSETDMYSSIERKLLNIKPGITDFSSIVFSDEGEILKDKVDPDISYNQLIRPGKSLLGLFYIENQSLFIDIQIILFTIVSVFSRRLALKFVSEKLRSLNADQGLIRLSLRVDELIPMPPPGLDQIVTNRNSQ